MTFKFPVRRGLALAAIAMSAALAACAEKAPPPPVAAAPPPPPPVSLSEKLVEQASAYRAYIDRASVISPAFTDGASVASSLKNAESYEPDQLLRGAVASVRALGYVVSNVDVTVIAEFPRIGPHASAIRARLSDALGVAAPSVSVKGKTNEGMGWIGRGEGVACIAVATLSSER